MALQAMVSPSQYENLHCDWNWDVDTVVKASGFVHHIESTSFLVAFKVLLEVLTNLRGLTTKLQMQAVDVFYAYKEVVQVVDRLKNMRSSSESEFSLLFQETSKLGKDLHGEEFELSLPRTSRRQVYRSNIPAQNAEEHYRVTIYNEFLSHVISELQGRFVDNSPHGFGLLHLIPSECHPNTSIPGVLTTAVDFYSDDLPHALLFPTEYRMWVRTWCEQGHSPVPKTLVETLVACDSKSFPNIQVLLQIALTLPITSC